MMRELLLPELQGSPKQVKWAHDIREPIAEKCRAMLAQFASHPKREPWELESATTIIQEVFVEAEFCKASWWIGGRSGSCETRIENEILFRTQHAKISHDKGKKREEL